MNNIILKIREKENKVLNIRNKCDTALYYLDEIKRYIINDLLNKPDTKPNDIITWFNSLSLEEKDFLGLNEMDFIFILLSKVAKGGVLGES